MKALLLHNRYKERGGEDVAFDRERQMLRGLGVTVEEVLVSNDSISSALDAARVALSCGYSEDSRRLVEEKIRAFRPDIVHAHNTFPILTRSVWDACSASGVPLVQTLHNYRIFCANALLLRNGEPCTLCLDQKPWRSVAYGCYRGSKLATVPVARMIDRQLKEKAWSKVDLFLAVTDFAKSMFLQLGIPEEKLFVKNNHGPDLRKDLGTEASAAESGAIYFGRLSQEKGLGTLLSAWKSQPFPLRVLGDGPLAPTLKEGGLAPELGLPQRECWGLMAKARCLVVPTECFEGGFPLVIVEALSLGLPVISTTIGSVSNYLRDGKSALLVPPRDPQALANAVQRVLRDDELWWKLSTEGRRVYEGRFTEEKCGASLMAAYQRAISARSSRS